MHRACSTYPFGTSVEEMRGAGFAGSWPPFLVEAQTKVRSRVMQLNHGGAQLVTVTVTEGGLCRKLECTG